MEESSLRAQRVASTGVQDSGGEEVNCSDSEQASNRESSGAEENILIVEEEGNALDEELDLEKRRHGQINTNTSSPPTCSDLESPASHKSSREPIANLPQKLLPDHHTSCVREAQISPDGSCIFTSDYSRAWSVYPINFHLHSETSTRPLRPYAQLTSANPIWAFAVNPLFHFQDASSTHGLLSRRDSYITLHNALWDMSRSSDRSNDQYSSVQGPVDISKPLASYKLVDHLTEAVVAPSSLTYSHDGAYFFAGAQNRIATFDLTYTDDPIHSIPTIPSKRNKLKGGGRGFKGCISALSLSLPSTASRSGTLAAGSRTRYVGIYDPVGGTEVTHFALPGTMDGRKLRNENLHGVIGDGVSQVKWSPDGMYLYVAERQSDVLFIYDVRNFSLSLGHCAGRAALTMQRLGFDVWSAATTLADHSTSFSSSHQVWAGGTDGKVRVWRDAHLAQGARLPSETLQVQNEKTPVVSALVNSFGNLMVAASGFVEIDEKTTPRGRVRGGGTRPHYREGGSVDIFRLE